MSLVVNCCSATPGAAPALTRPTHRRKRHDRLARRLLVKLDEAANLQARQATPGGGVANPALG